jgi:hypothetical protein
MATRAAGRNAQRPPSAPGGRPAHFFSDAHMRWTYVGSCPAMLSQLRRHLAGRPLCERLSAHLADIDRIHTQLPPRSHDVVLLNLVLSSMPALPDRRGAAGVSGSAHHRGGRGRGGQPAAAPRP